MSYFVLTTISTIGIGDLTPISYQERLVWSLVLMFGVTSVSFIINKLMQMVIDFREIYRDNRQRDLANWINLLSKYNDSIPIDKELIMKIESYFNLDYESNRMRAFKAKKDDIFVT
jgi:hypothetical protein